MIHLSTCDGKTSKVWLFNLKQGMDKEALHTSDVIDPVQLSLKQQGIEIIEH
jgi:hypothetical protein